MNAESVTRSWLWHSSESGRQVFRWPLVEGVLNPCFLLSHVGILTSERPGKSATPSNLF